jgi:hypothetical protein
MNYYFILLLMIFLHILDDYGLQAPCLCNLKQRSYWEINAPNPLYRYDYLWALLMHSFSWSFMIMLPIAWAMSFNITIPFICVFIANVGIHALTDHLKANEYKINLWEDQIIHIGQILITSTLAL